MSDKRKSIPRFFKNILIIVLTNVILIFGLFIISYLFSRYATEYGVDPDEWSEAITLSIVLSIICTSISLTIFFLASVINYFLKKKIRGLFPYCTVFVYLLSSVLMAQNSGQFSKIISQALEFTLVLMIPVLLSLLVLWIFNRKNTSEKLPDKNHASNA